MKYTEIDQNRIIILQKTCNRGHSWKRYIGRTDIRQTEIHTFFICHPCVGREHNSPSGNKSYNVIPMDNLECGLSVSLVSATNEGSEHPQGFINYQ